ncbi:hypothetical protein Syun_027220 [Stephania yunnanensis]|uniref:DUF7032 domain-containing protein n=1 Tax=Stephania yunnanensis TaxID=152371 RepID=A0AAP0HML5_9MAGN
MGVKKSLEEAREHNEDQGLNESTTNLRQVIERLSSLLSLSHSTKVFHGKWQMIREKLEKLYTGLTAAENCDFASNSAFSELTKAISVTLKSCTDLADRCVNLSYSGKLLMQSDLDVVSSKFDAHLKSLGKVYNAGILNQAQAIVVLKPGVGASRDDMKFYVKDLLTRLKIGGSVMKRQALDGLDEVISEDEKYVKIVVETSEILGLLVNFLESGSVEIQEQSAKIVLVIAGFDSYKSTLVGAGVIAPLIRVLESGSEMGKKWQQSQELMSASCGVLKNLAGVEEIRRFMVEEGAISTFIRVMNSKDEVSFEVRDMAAEALCKMVWVSKNRKRFIQDNFNTDRILQLLNSDEAKTGNKKFLLSILLSLTNAQSGRKAIASSRYRKNLERLAETGIGDARSIMKKLSRNRLQSLLSGILNI